MQFLNIIFEMRGVPSWPTDKYRKIRVIPRTRIGEKKEKKESEYTSGRGGMREKIYIYTVYILLLVYTCGEWSNGAMKSGERRENELINV